MDGGCDDGHEHVLDNIANPEGHVDLECGVEVRGNPPHQSGNAERMDECKAADQARKEHQGSADGQFLAWESLDNESGQGSRERKCDEVADRWLRENAGATSAVSKDGQSGESDDKVERGSQESPLGAQ